MANESKKQRALTVSPLDYLHDAPLTAVSQPVAKTSQQADTVSTPTAEQKLSGHELTESEVAASEVAEGKITENQTGGSEIAEETKTDTIKPADKNKPVNKQTSNKQTVGSKPAIAKPVATAEPVSQQPQQGRGGRPKRPERERFTLNVNKKYIGLVRTGRLEEKFVTDSDFLDHIFENYFKDKPYNP